METENAEPKAEAGNTEVNEKSEEEENTTQKTDGSQQPSISDEKEEEKKEGKGWFKKRWEELKEKREKKAADKKAEKEKREADKKAEKEKREADKKAEKEKREADKKAEKEKREADKKAEKEKREADKKAEKEKREADKKAEKEKREAEKKAEKEKREAEKKAEKEKREADKKAEKDKREAEKKAEKEKREADKKAEKDKKKEERAKRRADRKAKRKENRAKFTERYTLNPFSRVRYGGKETLKTAFSLPANIVAKAAHIVGRPQSLFVGEMWSDLAKNTGRGFVNLFRTIGGTVYKPYRTKLPYENIFKDYGASFNPEGSKGLSALGLGLLRGFWSIPRIPAQLVEGVAHSIGETATGKFDYTHTTDAFKKAFSIIHDKPASSSDTAKK